MKVNFSDPYIVVGQAILLNNKHEGTVKSYKDLNDPKYVLTSRMGTTGEQAIKRMIPKATYKGFESEAEAGMEVINGKADALVYDLPFVGVIYGQHGQGNALCAVEAAQPKVNGQAARRFSGSYVQDGIADFTGAYHVLSAVT